MTAHPERVREYLGHMHDALARIRLYLRGKSRTDFFSDSLLQDAVVRNFEILGEAARNILECSPDAPKKYPNIPFAAIYGMRNQLSHGYFAIDFDIVWNVIERDLPALSTHLETILARVDRNEN